MISRRAERNFHTAIVLSVFCSIHLLASLAQGPGENSPIVLKTESTFVWIPTLIKTRDGADLAKATPTDLRVFDNGVAQHFEKIETEGLPISLVILMQPNGCARMKHYLSS